ncbi:helix-turn-helix domain-containing protein [Amycolatopsis halotolerans]|uniref:Helix-turn-helix domain-containing protein n=1 Tax=Amycolatopsis halotolerans TaxID=330083 RepID=A0ABV7QTM2_9PSEU
MKGLLLRLSAVDSGAETAVRVIAYFDELIARRATLPDLLRATAFLAECVAGIRCVDGTVLRFRPTGEPGGDGPVPPGAVVVDLDGAGRVWLERAGEPGPLDVLVLERLAISAKVLNPVEPQPAAPHLADPALVELVLGEQAADEDRTRALTLLGLDTTRPLRVVAVASGPGRDAGADAVALVARGGPLGARVAVVGGVAAVVLQPREGPDSVVPTLRETLALRAKDRTLPDTVRVGVGDAVDGLAARSSWLQARLAKRFAAKSRPLIVHEDLGAVTLLAEIPAERLCAQPDVLALNALAGSGDLETLEAFCRTGSLRQAAIALHRHHSSVAARLAQVEDALGWTLDDPAGRFRARLALAARRLAESA